jgi:uncharacterized Zn ribbon protein
MEHSHNCIKCLSPYQSSEPDPYYCEACLKEKKELAAQIDAKFAATPKEQPKSDLQRYDELRFGKSPFVRAGDLGIRL